MDRHFIIKTITAYVSAGILDGIVIPVSYYGNLFRMSGFVICADARGNNYLCVSQDIFRDGKWEDCNGDIVPLEDYDDEYLQRMYRSMLDKVTVDKNLF